MAFVPSKPLAELPRRKKGPKGPNPLSVKKKKLNPDDIAPRKRQKGKEKVRGTETGAKVSDKFVGEKRKRSGDDNQGQEGHSGEATAMEGGGHKRKRRRKGAPHNSVIDP